MNFEKRVSLQLKVFAVAIAILAIVCTSHQLL